MTKSSRAVDSTSDPAAGTSRNIHGHQGAAAARASAVAVNEVSITVERMQTAITERVRTGARIVGQAVPGTQGIADATNAVLNLVDDSTRLHHTSVRRTGYVVAEVVGAGLRTHTEATDLASGARGAAALAGIGAALGDHLGSSQETASLTTPMAVRVAGHPVELTGAEIVRNFADPTDSLVIFVHGLAATELAWGEDYSTVGREQGFTPVLVRYNSGLAVSENGRSLAQLLCRLLESWPVPARRLVLVGHSMGGLVIRAACAEESSSDDLWQELLTDVVTLATPHRGAPLEKVANLAISGLRWDSVAAPLADLLNRRSHGIKDLRFGTVRTEDWGQRDPDCAIRDTTEPLPLPDGVRHHAAVATLSSRSDGVVAHTVGDGLVRPASASFRPSGSHATLVQVPSAGHNDLLDHEEITHLLSQVLEETATVPPR